MRVSILIVSTLLPGALGGAELVRFPPRWTSPYRVDPDRPHHLVNGEGRHLFILGKTAWNYFGCKDPAGVVARARAQGITVLRVNLEGAIYFEDLGIDLWPWGGTRKSPDWSRFNAPYWDEVERRVRLAGEAGLGLDVVLYTTLQPRNDRIEEHRPYWEETLRRLGKYTNVLTWEIHNEFLGNETFQDAAGEHFARRDPHRRPVCTSDGTTDDAAWPRKAWVGLAINHSCTSSTPRHGLADWYLRVARRTRSYGKPAWCNESGREKRHRNDDAVHRRKQGWLWNAAGASWTWHSWEGCEGIDDAAYRGPGQEFLKPMADFWSALPFWELDPDLEAFNPGRTKLVWTALAGREKRLVVAYLATEKSGERVEAAEARLRLPAGAYQVTFIRPADGSTMESRRVSSDGSDVRVAMPLPSFTDDLAVKVDPIDPKEN